MDCLFSLSHERGDHLCAVCVLTEHPSPVKDTLVEDQSVFSHSPTGLFEDSETMNKASFVGFCMNTAFSSVQWVLRSTIARL